MAQGHKPDYKPIANDNSGMVQSKKVKDLINHLLSI
jgi:hypothetical protein